MWKILDTGRSAAAENMRIDGELLENMKPDDDPILHFYEWEGKAATYGYFLETQKYLDLKKVEAHGLSLARRPTGGGIIFHVTDFAFSVLVPAEFPHYSINTLDNYDFINSAVKRGVKNFLETAEDLTLLPNEPVPKEESCRHFCMAKPTIYDVMLGGKKIAGAAQRRRKQGYLHQGSISIALPDPDLLNEVLLEKEVKRAMESNTLSLLQGKWTPNDLEEVRENLKQQLQKELTQ